MAPSALSFPIAESRADEELGNLALEGSFFQRKPPLEFIRGAGRKWFQDNRTAIRGVLTDNPALVEFFSASNERRNDILAVIGDIVIVAGIGIPVLLLLSKIAHYGVDKLMADTQDDDGDSGDDGEPPMRADEDTTA